MAGIFIGDLPPMTSPRVSAFLGQTEAPPAGAGGFCVREAECQLLSELRGWKASGTAADVGVAPKQEVAERDALAAVRRH